MPTVTVDKDAFFKSLGRTYSHQDFDELLFQYGLELDEDTEQTLPNEKPYKLKIEVPANRYDLLCHEGLAIALGMYIGTREKPKFRVVEPKKGEHWTAVVHKELADVRPYFSSAILRGVRFDPVRYASFIDLQEKLHGNLCRRRELVSIGTHDLSKMTRGDGKVHVEARPPQDIKFKPLVYDDEHNKEMTGEEIVNYYESHRQLSRYLHLLRAHPLYPIIYDSSRTVLSMPPLINSDHTKITLETTDVFIDVTATDFTKLGIVTDIVIAMFSEYCTEPFTVEPVNIEYEAGTPAPVPVASPLLQPLVMLARASYVNSCTGLSLSVPDVISLLEKMGHSAKPLAQPLPESNPDSATFAVHDTVEVSIPATRPDILHECDIMEEVAIAYGFDNLKKSFPATSTVAVPLPLNKLSDVVRKECAYAGWLEVAPLTLCSHDENFAFLNRPDPGNLAVVLQNPKTTEYQIIRTSLLPGILKTVRENRKHPLPLRVFEVGDVVVQHPEARNEGGNETGTKNLRRLGAVYCGRKAGFEIVQGLLDRVMGMLGVVREGSKEVKARATTGEFYIVEHDDATYFPNRSAKIFFRPLPSSTASSTTATTTTATQTETAAAASKISTSSVDISSAALPTEPQTQEKSTVQKVVEKLTPNLGAIKGARKAGDIEIGSLGILHPTVLRKYELDYPCSAVEIDLEGFL